jgi:hypothetical protein
LKAREILNKKSVFKGGRLDIDTKPEEMDEDGKEVFRLLNPYNVLATDDGEYAEIDDDFILMLNGGVAPSELIKEKKIDSSAYDNKGVIHFDELLKKAGPETGEGMSNDPNMIDNYKERMADVIAMLDKQKEYRENAK